MTIVTQGPMKSRGYQLEDARVPRAEQLGAAGNDAFEDSATQQLIGIHELTRAKGDSEIAPPVADPMGAPIPSYEEEPRQKPGGERIDMIDALDQVKKAGLDKTLKLPNEPDIAPAALQIMIDRARTRAEHAATIARGPQGIVPDAMMLGTSFLVGAIDPLNIASAFVPVMGELRYGKLLASAGESAAARAGVRAGVGAAQGVTGQALLEPIDWYAHSQDGRDFGMSDVLHNLVFGGLLGAGLHTGGGALSDAWRAHKGRPLYPYGPGEPLDRTAAAASPAETAAAIRPDMDAVDRVLAGQSPAPLREVAPQFAVLDDLPPRAQEDAARASIASLLDGTPVRSAELLDAAAQTDPRIAESFALAKPPAPLTPQAARQAVADDIRQKLLDAGLPPEQADANAALTAARYHARADRLGAGQSALDLYRGENIAVRGGEGGEAEAGRVLNQRGEPDLFAAREAEGQQSLPGTERIGQGEAAQRGADAPLKPGVAQQPADQGLFGDTAAQKSFFQSAPQAAPFYSAVDRAIGAAKQDKASPEQWLGTLKNSAGVKGEEMKWLGLEDWLKDQQGPVSKQQLQDYVRANAIEVKEVAKGAPRTFASDEILNEARADAEAAGEDWNSLGPNGRQRFYDEARRQLESAAGATKYTSYTLPGGENYRELLLTLPNKGTNRLAEVSKALEMEMRNIPSGLEVGWRERLPPETVRRIADLMSEQEALQSGHEDKGFTSSHWDEPNVLAHIRFDDRISDGKKTLHLAELQSDWHQMGKRKGYRGDSDRADAQLAAEVERKVVGKGYQNLDEAVSAGAISRAEADAYNRELVRESTGVPDAPFKTTWPELSMKRMIRYAAEHGYDRVSWDTGATNAERYDLSKQISRIQLEDNSSGGIGRPKMEGPFSGGMLHAYDHQGKEIISQYVNAAEELPDLIGKEAADKIINAAPKEATSSGFGVRRRKLEGLDLKVGGEGMAGFYDRILPATVNKLVKKFGAKVEEGKLEKPGGIGQWEYVGPELSDHEIFLKARERGMTSMAANQLREIALDVEGGMPFARAVEKNGSYHVAEILGGELKAREGETQIHSLDLTPELRAAALEHGFPLFQGGAESPRGRITLANNRAIIDLYKSSDASTFLHESGHLWLDELMRDAGGADAPAALRADRDTVLAWLGVKHADEIGTAQHERWAEGFEQYLKIGEAPSGALAQAFAQFKAWLTEIYRALAGSGQEVSPQIKGVMDRLLATEAEIADRADELGASTRAVKPSGPRGRAASDPQTWSLFEYLASKGGLKPDPELAALFGPGRGPFLGGFGPLLRRDGMALDEALRVAKEGHYLFDAGDISGAEAHLTPRDLLDTLDREGRGTKVYRNDHVPEREIIPEEEARAIVDALHRELQPDPGKGVAIDPKLEARVVQIVQKEGEHDVLAAYERAIMEDAERYEGLAQARRQDEATSHIPGWDAAEPAAAPRDGAADRGGSRETGLSAAGAGAADGGGPRTTGAGDRAPGAAQSGPTQLAAGLRPQGQPDPQAWHALARAVPEYDAPDAVRASEQAAAAPEPVAVNAPQSERLKAALAAEARSAELFEAKAAFLAPEERVRVDDLLRTINLEEADRREIFARGAVCLAEAAGLVA